MSRIIVIKLLLAASVLVLLFDETHLCNAMQARNKVSSRLLDNQVTQASGVNGQRSLTSLRRTSNLMSAEFYPAYREYVRRIRRTQRQRAPTPRAPVIFSQKQFNPETFSADASSLPKATSSPNSPSNSFLGLPHSTAVANEAGQPLALNSGPRDGIYFPGDHRPIGTVETQETPSSSIDDKAHIDDKLAGPDQENSDQATPQPNANRKNFRTYHTPSCAPDDNRPCERDSDYDQFIISKMEDILERTQLNSVFDNNVISHLINDTAIVKQKDILPQSVLRTGNNLITETPACNAVESIIYPQRAKTQAQDWVFVVNQDMVRQGVRVEKCLREGESCSLGADLPPTVTTVCRQKFIYRKLLVLTNEGTDIQPESVLIPSCCVCYVRSNFFSKDLDRADNRNFIGN